jgi:hypothetical protein
VQTLFNYLSNAPIPVVSILLGVEAGIDEFKSFAWNV